MADYRYVIQTNNGTKYTYEGNDDSVNRHIKLNEKIGARIISKEKLNDHR